MGGCHRSDSRRSHVRPARASSEANSHRAAYLCGDRNPIEHRYARAAGMDDKSARWRSHRTKGSPQQGDSRPHGYTRQVSLTAHNRLGSCNAACGRYRRRHQNGSLGRGAGHPSAELALGSRGVMNRRTLAEIGSIDQGGYREIAWPPKRSRRMRRAHGCWLRSNSPSPLEPRRQAGR